MKLFAFLFTLALFSISKFTSAQLLYQKTYGTPEYKLFKDACPAPNNGVLAAGFWSPSIQITPTQPFLTQVDLEGNVLWSKEYASTGVGQAKSVTPTSDGGYVCVGVVDTILGIGGSQDGYVLKVDAAGSVEWMTIVGSGDDEEFERVYEAFNGDIIAIGTSEVQATGNEQFWFVKMNATGSLINSFVYFPTANAEAHALAFHPDGGYVIGGIGRVNFIDEAYLFKISSTGVLEWYKSYGTFGGSERINDLFLLSDNSVVFTGTRYQANYDVFIGKTDAIGQLSWIKNYGGLDHEDAYRVQEHNGGFVVSGYSQGIDGVMGPMIFKTNAAGDLEWAKVYGNDMPSGSLGMVQPSIGGFAIAGTILPDQGSAVGYINRLNENGEGCDFTSIILPLVTETTVEGTPVVWASIGPSLSSAYNPTVSDVTLVEGVTCSVAGIEELTNELVEIYPNPVEGSEFLISASDYTTTNVAVEIFDCTGRLMYTQNQLHHDLRVSTIGWLSGVYLVKVEIESQRVVKRIVLH